MEKKILGLIAGNGKFPFLFAQKAKSRGYTVIAAAIRADTSPFLRFFVAQLAWFKVGELQKLFLFFQQQGVSEVIMAGQVNPENLFEKNVVFDKEFQQIFEAIRDRKADTIFSAVADKLQATVSGFWIPRFYSKNILRPKGP